MNTDLSGLEFSFILEYASVAILLVYFNKIRSALQGRRYGRSTLVP